MGSIFRLIMMSLAWAVVLSPILDLAGDPVEGLVEGSAEKKINIHVSILPQKYFVERIGGDKVAVTVLVNPGKNPATYSPSPVQIKRLASSDVYFRIGVPFENGFIDKIESVAGSILVVDTREGIALRDMGNPDDTNEPHLDRDHGPDQDHHHLGKDPHIWMNPVLVKIGAATILKALIKVDPANRIYYNNNYNRFIKDLDELDKALETELKGFKGETLFVFHPSFGYFTDRYGLKQLAVETMGKAPKGRQISAIIKLAKKQKTRVIFVQPQFDSHAAKKIASAINGSVISIDPLAYDYLSNMRSIAEILAMKLRQ